MLTARIRVAPRERSFTARLYLRSTSGQDVSVAFGRGSAGVRNVPEFLLGDLRIMLPTYLLPLHRSTELCRPEFLETSTC